MNGTCTNCSNTLTGKYCSNCGQDAHIGRLTLHELLHDLWHYFTHTDKGVLRLLKDLTLHPRSVYENYFQGQRKKYFSPVVFFLVAAGLLAWLYPHVFEYQNKINHLNDEFGEEIAHQGKYRALALLPFEALLTWLFFFRRFNLAETTVFWLYVTGFTSTIKLVFLPIYWPMILHKGGLDVFFDYLTLAIGLLHGILVFGRSSLYNTFLIVLVVNICFMFDLWTQLFVLYEKFGKEVWDLAGIHSVWDFIKFRYLFWN